MSTTDEEAEWRAEFERDGETLLRDALNFRSVPLPEPKRQFAFRWLREEEKARETRERQLHQYAKRTLTTALWTLVAAVAGAIVSIVGVFVTWWVAR